MCVRAIFPDLNACDLIHSGRIKPDSHNQRGSYTDNNIFYIFTSIYNSNVFLTNACKITLTLIL